MKKRIRKTFTHNGKRYFAEGRTLEEAIANRERMKWELEHGVHVGRFITVNELAELWYDRLDAKTSITQKTIDGRKSVTNNYILPLIGGMRVANVKELHITMVLENAAKGHTKGHVKNVLAALRQLFRLALANDLCSKDPCEYVSCPDATPQKIRREATIIERNNYVGHMLWLDLVILCGLRPGETARVRYKDIGKGYLYVDGTKNKNAKRYVPLPESLRARLLIGNKGFGNEYICKLSANQRTRSFKKLQDTLKLPKSDLEPYCFRHSYVTDLAHIPGMTIANIKRIAGHSLEGMTDRYTHSRYEEAVKVLPMLEKYWSDIAFIYEHNEKTAIYIDYA